MQAGRRKAAYLEGWPELASLEESASVPPTSTSQWIISVRHISPLHLQNGIQAAGGHVNRMSYDPRNDYAVDLRGGCKGKSADFKKR